MTKIDDEMVERAAKAAYEADERYPGDWSKAYHTSKSAWKNFIRVGLEAALSPKPEPEIEVSEGMRWAAMNYANHKGFLLPSHFCELYRVMRAKEAQEGAAYAAKSAPQGASAGAPVKETGGRVERRMRAFTVHSRKTDEPKEDCSHVWPHRRKAD